jgi:plastocyanin
MSRPRSFRATSFALLVLLPLVAVACGGSEPRPPLWTPLPPETSEAPTGSQSPEASAPGTAAPSEGTAAPSEGTAAPSEGSGGEAASVTIGTDTGAALQFDPTTATVAQGSTVELTFENRSTTVPHNLTFDEPINEATATIVDPGASETLEFTAPEPGDYQFVCTLHPGMEGTLTVEGG